MTTKLPTFVIVDDSATTRAIITRVIRMTGLPIGSLVEAANGQDALNLMQNCPVSLVLADLNMPVMDGIEMIAEMRRRDKLKKTPVIVISAQPDPDQIEKLHRSGVNKYLAKPFTPEAVREAIESVMSLIEHEAPSEEPMLAPGVSGPINLNLAEALAEALETMAFMCPELSETAEWDATEEVRLARVGFRGERFKGSLSLSAPRGFGVAVARNCAMNDAEAQADDALKELTNVTCGLFLRKRIGGGTGFVLTPPMIDSANKACGCAGESDCVSIKAEGFLVAAHVTPEAMLVDAMN